MAKDELPPSVTDDAVVVIEKDWTRAEEKKAKRKYVYLRHQLWKQIGSNSCPDSIS